MLLIGNSNPTENIRPSNLILLHKY